MKKNSDNNINLKDVNFLTNTPKSYGSVLVSETIKGKS